MDVVPKTFCNGLEKFELIGGGCVRLTFYENRTGVGPAHMLNQEIILPLTALPLIARQLKAGSLWGEVVSPTSLPLGVRVG